MRNTIFNKKAAMFGLDARIALAIFGALSVISGAALYSAIKQAKVIAFVAQLEEISKAIDSYRLDTASDVATHTGYSGSNYLSGPSSTIGHLIENTDNKWGWKGPYLPFTRVSNQEIRNNDYKIFSLLSGPRSAAGNISAGQGCHRTNNECDLFIQLSYNGSNKQSAIDLFKSVDEYIDGGDGFRDGKVHFIQTSNTTMNLDASLSGIISILYKHGAYISR
jgi:type II secretory pathway pseudopilin PulG